MIFRKTNYLCLINLIKMNVQKNISLKPYNTFGIEALASTFIEVKSEQELQEALSLFPEAYIWGGGSNIPITKDMERPIIKISTKGISVSKENKNDKLSYGENGIIVNVKATSIKSLYVPISLYVKECTELRVSRILSSHFLKQS